MGAKSGGKTHKHDLEDAIEAADLTPSDYRVYRRLLYISDHGTALIPPRWQPKSLIALADSCHISLAGVKRSVSHLQRHGWLERYRHITDRGIGGRSHPTYYKLLIGCDCTCKAAHGEPVSGGKAAQAEPGNRLMTARNAAGQGPDFRGEAVGRGVREDEALTVEIAGETFEAIRCAGCSAPVPVKFAVDGRHAGPGCQN